MKKWKTIINKYKYCIQLFRSPWKPETWFRYILKYITFPLWFASKKLTYQKSIKILSTDHKEFTYVLVSPLINDRESKFNNISFQAIRKPFLDFQVNVPKDFHKILKNLYGDYMIPVDYGIVHINALSTRRRNIL